MIRRSLLAALFAATGLSACAPQPQTVYVTPQQVAPARVCDTTIVVSNQSSATVMELQFSPTGVNSWGPDQLGANVIYPRQAYRFRPARAGLYDFRVNWAGGRAAEIRNVDVCRASNIIITNAGLRWS